MANNNKRRGLGNIKPELITDAAPDGVRKKGSNRVQPNRKVIQKSNRSNGKMWVFVAAILVITLIGSGYGLIYHSQASAVASVISLDVNPSIELRVNRDETVLSCKAMNEDATVVLSEMSAGADLEGTKLDVAVNAILGSMLRHGYLDSISSSILISVEDNDQDRASSIQKELVAVVDNILQGASSQIAVYSQNMTISTDLEAQAQSNNISSGKAYLVTQVLAQNASLDFDALAALSVEELHDLIKINAPDMPIGMDAAAQAAQEYAGTLSLSSNVVQDVDPELDELRPHYDVELRLPDKREFEYEIDAFTGEVLSGQRDIVGASADTKTSKVPSGETSSSGNLPTSDIGSDAAKAAALSHAGLSESQVDLLTIVQDWDDGRLEYDVKFIYNNTAYECTIDGITATVRDYETEPVSTVQGQNAQNGSQGTSDIGAEAAKAAALSHAGLSESQVSRMKVERDRDNGHLEYEVEFIFNGYEYKYTISGTTGAVLEHEVDLDD